MLGPPENPAGVVKPERAEFKGHPHGSQFRYWAGPRRSADYITEIAAENEALPAN